MRLVIAEKRSVAFAIAQALGDVRQGDGYVSAGETLISWAQGHLVGSGGIHGHALVSA